MFFLNFFIFYVENHKEKFPFARLVMSSANLARVGFPVSDPCQGPTRGKRGQPVDEI